MSSLQYRPEIDGLRAFAVIPVLLFHLGISWMSGGFLGVDVFFVISGFLITKTILTELDQNRFSFKAFWARRIRRILPALLCMITLTLIAGYFILHAPDINELGHQGVAALLSLANVYFWQMAGNYWGAQAESSALLHTWSLSVEEQFYLFHPFLVVFLHKFLRRWMIPAFALILAGSLALFLYGMQHMAGATFYLLPTRIWELGGGCLLALLAGRTTSSATEKSQTLPALYSAIGLAAVVASYLFSNGEQGISVWAALPVAGAALVIAFTRPGSIVYMLLSARPIVYIGKISYSLYLWHWPVLVLQQQRIKASGQEHASQWAALALIVPLAIASYHWIEQPLRRRRKVEIPILLGTLAAIALALFLALPQRMENVEIYNPTLWRGAFYNTAPVQGWTPAEEQMMRGVEALAPEERHTQAFATGGIVHAHGTDRPQIVVLGDSHALMWGDVLNDIAKELNQTICFYTANGTPVFFEIPVQTQPYGALYFTAEQKARFDQMRLECLSKWKPKIVIIATRWSKEYSSDPMHDLMKALNEIGSTVLLIEQPPELFIGERCTPQYLAYMGLRPEPGQRQYIPKKHDQENRNAKKWLRELNSRYPNTDLVLTRDIYEHNHQAWVLDGADVLYIDDDHLSEAGAEKGRERLKEALLKHL